MWTRSGYRQLTGHHWWKPSSWESCLQSSLNLSVNGNVTQLLSQKIQSSTTGGNVPPSPLYPHAQTKTTNVTHQCVSRWDTGAERDGRSSEARVKYQRSVTWSKVISLGRQPHEGLSCVRWSRGVGGLTGSSRGRFPSTLKRNLLRFKQWMNGWEWEVLGWGRQEKGKGQHKQKSVASGQRLEGKLLAWSGDWIRIQGQMRSTLRILARGSTH